MRALGVVLFAFAVAAFAPAVAGVSLPADATKAAPGLAAHCSTFPPCGYIYPTIIVTSPVKGTLWLNESMDIPLTIVFEWNFDNEGTGLHDASDPIKLTFDAPKKPNWVDWTVDPAEIVLDNTEFQPANKYSYEFTAMLTLTPDLTVPVEERAGAKMLLFVQSSESGTFKKSYGVEIFRFPTPDALGAAGDDVNPLPSVGATGSLLAFAAVAAAVAVVLRKKR